MKRLNINNTAMVEGAIKGLFDNGYLKCNHRLGGSSYVGWRNGKVLTIGVACDESSVNIIGDFENDVKLKAILTEYYHSVGIYPDFSSRVGNTLFVKLYQL